MEDSLVFKNRVKEARSEQKISQAKLAELVGVSRLSLIHI